MMMMRELTELGSQTACLPRSVDFDASYLLPDSSLLRLFSHFFFLKKQGHPVLIFVLLNIV